MPNKYHQRHKKYTCNSNEPLIQLMFEEMSRHRVNAKQIAHQACVTPPTVLNWGKKNEPKLSDFIAVMNYLGWEVNCTKIVDRLGSRHLQQGQRNIEPMTQDSDCLGQSLGE